MVKKKTYRSSSRSISDLKAHLVLTTKFVLRLPLRLLVSVRAWLLALENAVDALDGLKFPQALLNFRRSR